MSCALLFIFINDTFISVYVTLCSTSYIFTRRSFLQFSAAPLELVELLQADYSEEHLNHAKALFGLTLANNAYHPVYLLTVYMLVTYGYTINLLLTLNPHIYNLSLFAEAFFQGWMGVKVFAP